MQSASIQPYLPLLFWGLVFVLSHFMLSGALLRTAIVGRIGEQPFLGLYSLLSFVMIFFFVRSYNALDPVDLGWMNQISLHWLSIILMPFILILTVAGLISPNPSLAGSNLTQEPVPVKGIFRITRHPMLWSFCLWAVVHIIAAGDTASVIFFAFLAFLAGYGTVMIDRKKARNAGQHWQEFADQTSNLPFAAIIAGRQQLVWAEIGWLPVIIGLALTALLYIGHLMIPVGSLLINPLS